MNLLENTVRIEKSNAFEFKKKIHHNRVFSDIREIFVVVDIVRPQADEGIVMGTYNDHPDSQALIFVPGQVKLHFVDHGEGGRIRLRSIAWKHFRDRTESICWKGNMEIQVPAGKRVTIPVTQKLALVGDALV